MKRKGDIEMKKNIAGVVIVAVMVVGVCQADFSSNVRLTLQETASDAVADLVRDPGQPENQTIGILPIHGDRDGFAEGLLRTALTKAGYTCVEIKESDFWEKVSEQFAWDTRRADILDSSTLLEFRKLMGTQMLLYGVLREASETIDRVYVEMELHVSSLETTRHVWGGVFSRRSYLDATVDGIVTLQPAVKDLLGSVVQQVAVSMNASPKLTGVQSVVVSDIAGDMENYVKGLVLQGLTNNTQLQPRDPGSVTLAEIRQMLRAEPGRGDAVLYGSVRDLSRKLKSELPLKKIYSITAELQLTIQNARTDDVLWSVTLSDSVEEVIEKPKDEAAYDWARKNPGTVRYILIGLGIVLLILLYVFISRPRRR
jgi:hypothetical protein